LKAKEETESPRIDEVGEAAARVPLPQLSGEEATRIRLAQARDEVRFAEEKGILETELATYRVDHLNRLRELRDSGRLVTIWGSIKFIMAIIGGVLLTRIYNHYLLEQSWSLLDWVLTVLLGAFLLSQITLIVLVIPRYREISKEITSENQKLQEKK